MTITDKTVKQIQRLLEALGHNPGKIDGIWGPKTQTALDNAEKKYCKSSSFDELVESTVPNDFWKKIKYFKRDEFKCRCGKCGGFPYEPVEKLLLAADDVRAHFGKPARVSSGVRCKTHNAAVGGVANSRHLYGLAMDFCVEGVSANKLLAYVASLKCVRYCYKIDNSYVHMDVEV